MRQIADDPRVPIDLDIVPAADPRDDTGAGDQRCAHADLPAPEPGRETLGDDALEPQMRQRPQRRIMRVPIAEIAGTHDQVPRAYLGGERGIIALHRRLGEFGDVGDLDVLDADDEVDIEVLFLENPGDAALEVGECHDALLRDICGGR